ncbi:putative tocopherol O-methyltransferase [Cardiosporidium cionae]|uniref:Tocopherol O-methyltransferase n=1 Tax=Cardiosporidium cionae TaxID=476202 RepID=A0ABQ7JBU0_9APIC|nr:putative tocopherol O-methyltransferase [Cardiosporidium cionae]|eukprot:KAF8821477.1 putative tocopherol O-methyltransferase [Cardiosporidium cionae]
MPYINYAVTAVVSFSFVAWCVAYFFNKPIRKYNKDENTVGKSYDEWTDDYILESYWGDHIHLGYYTEEERNSSLWKADFKKAKVKFVEELLKFCDLPSQLENIVDVGCGIGGTSRILAKKFPRATVLGITLSAKQVSRAIELAQKEELGEQCYFSVMDATDMRTIPDSTMDLVWVCESSEHVADKAKLISEAIRVAKSDAKILVAVWCQRDDLEHPFLDIEKQKLQYLYDQWSHPPFVSAQKMKEILYETGKIGDLKEENWTAETLPSWHHNLLLGFTNPWPWISRPQAYLRLFRDAWCTQQMHNAFSSGLMEYYILVATVKK